MIRSILTVSALAFCGLAMAKLPPPDDAAKAKAAEAAARTGWVGKVDAYLTCKAQDRVVAHYKKTAATRPVATPTTTPTATAAVAAANTPTTPVAAAPTPGAAAAAMAAGATSPAAAAASTAPVAVAPVAGSCQDPGPFAYSPPEQKPLEVSGAHSPASNATSPPSFRADSATMAPAGPATQQSKKP